MTRTARAAYPRAVNKDRSESRTGLYDMARKGGAGQHNWGSLADERQLESAALDDVILDEEETEEITPAQDLAAESPSSKSEMTRTISGGLSPEELEQARQFRKNALKAEIDLTAIARTSAAVVGSPH
ncbi:hypothetical protein BDN70DRAFT_798470 [Pholiota conissans]|uniref:Hyaluronan/mRNA-binding protein domain-containing protein n=1 Tax=Pholiota conissans TaxID=109636 RepID=A0A9P6D5I4_9AGAR|nr:hypothetical protein BDN70DRAFT_798470 [Pholiota conissans]